MTKKISDIIYKFCDLDTGVEKLLIEGSLKFTCPTDFNDPFEFHTGLIKADIDSNYMDTLFYPRLSSFTEIEIAEVKKEVLKDAEKLINDFRKVMEYQKKSFKVTSFSNEFDEILMWSHYGDKHGGICVGFLSSAFASNDLMPVNYVKDFQPINYLEDKEGAFNYWMTTKYKKWNYENEVRLLNPTETEFAYFDLSMVTEIIFGCQVDNDVIKETIAKLVTYGYDHVNFYKIEQFDNEFKLKRELINSPTGASLAKRNEDIMVEKVKNRHL